MRAPNASELAAAAWIAGGVAATCALMAATGDRHSITRGLRAHKVLTGVLLGAFALHIYGPPVTDPLHHAARALRQMF